MHCRSFGTVKHFGLDKGLVNIFSHLSTKSIQLTDQMSLSDTADRGIAGHLSESFNVVRKKQRLTSHASRSKGGFYTGMPAANHDDVVDLWKIHFL